VTCQRAGAEILRDGYLRRTSGLDAFVGESFERTITVGIRRRSGGDAAEGFALEAGVARASLAIPRGTFWA
jgi:hypothetical protein